MQPATPGTTRLSAGLFIGYCGSGGRKSAAIATAGSGGMLAACHFERRNDTAAEDDGMKRRLKEFELNELHTNAVQAAVSYTNAVDPDERGEFSKWLQCWVATINRRDEALAAQLPDKPVTDTKIPIYEP